MGIAPKPILHDHDEIRASTQLHLRTLDVSWLSPAAARSASARLGTYDGDKARNTEEQVHIAETAVIASRSLGEARVNRMETYITTSWDDGNPSDLRVAELLVKHGLRGTFYVPRTAHTGTMTATQLRELSAAYEIGAHTIHHVALTQMTKERAWQQIAGSKLWLEDTMGRSCSMFCPPMGAFSSPHLDIIRRAGFIGLRTVEFGSLDLPRWRAGLVVMPTTVQAYPHGLVAFTRNAAKRMAFANLWRFVTHGRRTDWVGFARCMLRKALDNGGVFHLWGHSWELREADQWTRLDEVLQAMKESSASALSLENGQIAQRFLTFGRKRTVCARREENHVA